MNGTSRNVTLRKFWPDLWEVFCMIKSQSLVFPFFPVSTEFFWYGSQNLGFQEYTGFQSLLRTQVTYIKLGCNENIIQMGCVTTFTYMCKTKTGCVTTLIIYTKKLLNSDWLRKECSSSVTRVQNV